MLVNRTWNQPFSIRFIVNFYHWFLMSLNFSHKVVLLTNVKKRNQIEICNSELILINQGKIFNRVWKIPALLTRLCPDIPKFEFPIVTWSIKQLLIKVDFLNFILMSFKFKDRLNWWKIPVLHLMRIPTWCKLNPWDWYWVDGSVVSFKRSECKFCLSLENSYEPIIKSCKN